MKSKYKTLLIVINVVLCFSFGFGALVFYKTGKPFMRGFYFNDESLSKPFLKNTVSSTLVILVSFGMCLASFIIIEAHKINRRTLFHSKQWIIEILILCCVYLLGAGITVFTTDIGKYTIGRLRPHFYSVCNLDWSSLNCTDQYGMKSFIVGDKYCRTSDLSRLKDARLSFPSGHSSFSAYSATFLILYLHIQLTWAGRHGAIPKLFIEVLIAILALYCGLTRISDYKHHPTDVVIGLLLGIFIGVIVSMCILNRNRRKETYDKIDKITITSENAIPALVL